MLLIQRLLVETMPSLLKESVHLHVVYSGSAAQTFILKSFFYD